MAEQTDRERARNAIERAYTMALPATAAILGCILEDAWPQK